MMRPYALVCGETSGELRRALVACGLSAFSCDTARAEDGGPHIQDDWRNVIPLRRWPLIIIHPTCTKVCVSGNHVYAAGKPRHHERVAACREIEADWDLVLEHADHAVLENPIGVLATQTRLGPASQIVQPYAFGDDASKATCLWLHNLPRLKPTLRVPGRMVEWPRGSGEIVERWANQTDSGQNRLGPSEDRWSLRSRTYPGIAAAIAGQLGGYVLHHQRLAA